MLSTIVSMQSNGSVLIRLKRFHPPTYFAAPTASDLEREKEVADFVEMNVPYWKKKGFMPDSRVGSGETADKLANKRGWTYWSHLFNPRHLLVNSLICEQLKDSPGGSVLFLSLLSANSSLSYWDPGEGTPEGSFSSRLSNPPYTFCALSMERAGEVLSQSPGHNEIENSVEIENQSAESIRYGADLWITDPARPDRPSSDEIYELFNAWMRTNPPPLFDSWYWHSHQKLAVGQSTDDDLLRMVGAYRRMACNMPENGRHCVIFSCQDFGSWGPIIAPLWAAGLEVTKVWLMTNQRPDEGESCLHSEGTAVVVLRKRAGSGSTSMNRLIPKIRRNVGDEIQSMIQLNNRLHALRRVLFTDVDVRVAACAEALKLLTSYAEVDGSSVGTKELPTRLGDKIGVVEEVIMNASDTVDKVLSHSDSQ